MALIKRGVLLLGERAFEPLGNHLRSSRPDDDNQGRLRSRSANQHNGCAPAFTCRP